MNPLKLFVLLTVLFFSTNSYAHKPSDSYLYLQEAKSTLSLRWDIAIRDLENIISLDRNHDREITWEELRASQSEISDYALSHLAIHQNNRLCKTTSNNFQVEKHSDGHYAVLNILLTCPESSTNNPSENIHFQYTLFKDIDPSHRGILFDQRTGTNAGPFVLSPEKNQLQLETQSLARFFIDYIVEGIWHIWIGLDHILFILVLILPFIMSQQNNASPQNSPRNLIAIISAFTLAHSLTLSIAVLGWVSLPSRWVETAIALSIIFTAWNNLTDKFSLTRWKLAFAFGLLHGFGFAAVLLDLGLPPQSIAVSLLGFNLGVEFGQLVIILCFFPLPFMLQNKPKVRVNTLRMGSLLAISISTLWAIERSLNIELTLFEFGVLSLLIFFPILKYKPRKATKNSLALNESSFAPSCVDSRNAHHS